MTVITAIVVLWAFLVLFGRLLPLLLLLAAIGDFFGHRSVARRAGCA